MKKLFSYLLISFLLLSVVLTVANNPVAHAETSSLIYRLTDLVDNKIDWDESFSTMYYGYVYGKVSLSELQAYVDSLVNGSDTEYWSGYFPTEHVDGIYVLRYYAVMEKLGVLNETSIKWALDNVTIMACGLPAVAAGRLTTSMRSYQVTDRAILRGFYYADYYDYDTSKWNITTAYEAFDAVVDSQWTNDTFLKGVYSITQDGAWEQAPNQYGRYYDERAETLDVYLKFYEMGVTEALAKAEVFWNDINVGYWTPNTGATPNPYYNYERSGDPSPPLNTNPVHPNYETESGGVQQILIRLIYHNATLGNASRLLDDFHERYLKANWSSPQWADNYGGANSHLNGQGARMGETLTAFLSIYGYYSVFNSSDQSAVQRLLEGYTDYDPAWELLFNTSIGYEPSTPTELGLYNETSGLFRMFNTWGGTNGTDSNYATAMATQILLMEAIVPKTGTIAVPNEELWYEYFLGVDPGLFQLDIPSHTLKLAVQETGELSFLFNATSTANFTQQGLWNVTFSDDWNTVESKQWLDFLPANRIYIGEVLLPHYNLTIQTSAGGTELVYGAGVHDFAEDTNVTIIASPSTGYTFSTWEIDGVNETNTESWHVVMDANHTAKAYFTPVTVVTGTGTIVNLYLRSDSLTTLGVTANRLDTDYTNTYDSTNVTASGNTTVSYGFRAWLVTSDTESVEITSGSPVGTITLTSNATGLWSGSYFFGGCAVTLGYQALKVIVYVRENVSSWQASDTFISPILMTNRIEPSTWLFRLYVTYFNNGTYTSSAYTFDTSNYRSRLENLAYIEPADSEVGFWRLNSGDLIGFLVGSYYDKIGAAFYVLILFGFSASLYRRYGHFGTVAFAFVLFAGPGGLLMLFLPAWAIIPAAILLIVGCTFIIWRLIR